MIQEELLAGFTDYLRYERRYSIHTLDGYTRDVSQYAVYLDLQYGFTHPGQANHHHVRSWVVNLLKAKNESVSIRRKLSSISHFYKWLRKTGVVDHNPVLKVQVPRIPVRLPKSIASKSINQLLDTLDRAERNFPNLRDQALIGLLYGAGLRRSEVIQLKWTDFDDQRRVLRVIGKGRKYRQVPVNEELANILRELKKAGDQHFEAPEHMEIIRMDNGKPCYPKYVHTKVVAMLGTVTTAEKKSPHILRHSMATHLMDEGAELNAVKGILGHASLAATQVYTHASIARIREVYSKAHPKSGHHE